MQLFLYEEHRAALFSTVRPRCTVLLTLLQGEEDDPQHLVPGGRFASPDFELAGCLVDEHLNARNDLRAPFLG